jgi:hypothetical protein
VWLQWQAPVWQPSLFWRRHRLVHKRTWRRSRYRPSSGPAGTVFTVSGDGCVGEAGSGDVLVTVFFTADEVVDEFGVTPDDDGTWSAEILTDEPTDLPPGGYDVTATCLVSPESEKVIVEYDFVEFELTAPPGPPPTEPPTTEPPTTPEAPPAAPVTKTPTFTG